MVLEGLDGDVTTNEYNSYIAAITNFPPPPSNNIGNVMVYERLGGSRLHGLQTFYAFTHDRRALDVAVAWSDGFLHARNDPVTGRVGWTGKRELSWPNKETNDEAHVLYSGAENGDVIEHICNTAKLILENPSLWPQDAPTDTYGFGKTYLDRAKTYVNECQKGAETTIVPWYVRNTKDGFRLYHPDSKVYFTNSEFSSGPVPWNQQQCIVGGLLRLAQCHRLLNDGNTNIAYYEKITGDAADWFFSTAKLVSVNGTNCYDWGYVLVKDPEEHREDTGHSFYDIYVLRAYDAHLGPSRVQIQRLINTALFRINLGSNRFGGYVNGVVNQYRAEREYLNYQWIEMSVLDRRLYEVAGNAVLAHHEYYWNDSVEAAMLYAKHFWATHTPEPLPVDEVRVVPQSAASKPAMWRYIEKSPLPAVLATIFGITELMLGIVRRFKAGSTDHGRKGVWLAWLTYFIVISLGITVSRWLIACRLPWPVTAAKIAWCLLAVGLIVRWSFVLRSRIDRVGIVLIVLALSLGSLNWAAAFVILIPCLAINRWSIRLAANHLVGTVTG